jgi:hypothetical protein
VIYFKITMMKAITLFLLLSFFWPGNASPQCIVAPPAPACNGTEPLLVSDETLNDGITKWYYGPTATMNSLTMNGGTLVVCGNLTIDKFYMDSGTVYIRPGARFVVGGGIGAGLVLKGNSYIYNYGTFEIQRNLSLDNGYATAAKPNIFINATSSSVFKMPNQYFVINNTFSKFVNNGYGEFWGIITDQQSTPGCVCLGKESITKMAILINKVANSYVVPVGVACVHVFQFSQFFGKLTSNSGLLACLGAAHTSDSGCIPFGCQPNNWGAAQVFTNCNNCSALIFLGLQFTSFTAMAGSGINKLSWEMSTNVSGGYFRVKRSGDGSHYYTIDSMPASENNTNHFAFFDQNPLPGTNYYMINYINPNGAIISTNIAKLVSQSRSALSIFPVPFENQFTISYESGSIPEKIQLTDMTGRNIRIRTIIRDRSHLIEVTLLDKIETGMYIIHLLTKEKYMAQTILKSR